MKNSAVKIDQKGAIEQVGRIINFAFVSLLFTFFIVALFYLFDKAAVLVAHSVIEV